MAIANCAFEKATGREIEWRRFDSGSKVLAAMASGDLEIGLAGSSLIAAGVSRGIDMQLFWIVEDIAAAEALVARDGSGIADPASSAPRAGRPPTAWWPTASSPRPTKIS